MSRLMPARVCPGSDTPLVLAMAVYIGEQKSRHNSKTYI